MPRGVYDGTKEIHTMGVKLTDEVYQALWDERRRCQSGSWAAFCALVAKHKVNYDPVCDAAGHDTRALRSNTDGKVYTVCTRCQRVISIVTVD